MKFSKINFEKYSYVRNIIQNYRLLLQIDIQNGRLLSALTSIDISP